MGWYQILKSAKIIFLLLFLFVIISFLITFFLLVTGHGCCGCNEFIWFDEENQCLYIDEIKSPPKGQSVPTASIFLYTNDIYSSGVGCQTYYLDSETLELETKAGKLNFYIQETELFLNSEHFSPETYFEKKSDFYWNPWGYGIVEITNQGSFPICGRGDESQTIYITGKDSRELNFNKGITIFVLLSILWISTSYVKSNFEKICHSAGATGTVATEESANTQK